MKSRASRKKFFIDIYIGADRGNRTPKACATASLVLRVYQFHHICVSGQVLEIYKELFLFSTFL